MKIAPGQPKAARRSGRTEAVILFVVGSQMFAISAGSIQEIRSTDSLSGSAVEIHQEKVPKVHRRLRRGNKFFYVVDAREHFGLASSKPTLVLVLRGTRVAVLADRIDRMDTISILLSLPRPFRGPERAWYRGVTLIDEEVLPVVSPSGFLTERELSFLDRVPSAAETAATGVAPSGTASPEDASGAVSQ
jgi:chemotaxis signal transduction protein